MADRASVPLTGEAAQQEVLDFLADPATYGLPAGQTVARVDTHISSIFPDKHLSNSDLQTH